MTSLSDYLESGLLHHLFRGESFSKPTNISIALCAGVPKDSDTGSTIPEVPTVINGSGTGYARISLGSPASLGDAKWSYSSEDASVGSGIIRNASSFLFDEGTGSAALIDWGWVSGIAITDHSTVGTGNLLMHAALENPRIIYTGDTVKFDTSTLQISFK